MHGNIEFLRFVPSETMRRYLSEKMSSGEFLPSPEDIVSTVYNGSGDVFEKADLCKKLLTENLSDNTRKQLEELIKFSEKTAEYVKNDSLRYAFVCGDFFDADGKKHVFNSFRKAAKHLRKTGDCYMAIWDKQPKKYIAELITDKKLRIIEANTYHAELWRRAADDITQRYVKYPVPFQIGDVVYCAEDPRRELFCVVNAQLPEYSECLDCIDSSITVIPYEYREYASPETVSEHYKRLAERRAKGEFFCSGISELDVISREHEHISVLNAELYKN